MAYIYLEIMGTADLGHGCRVARSALQNQPNWYSKQEQSGVPVGGGFRFNLRTKKKKTHGSSIKVAQFRTTLTIDWRLTCTVAMKQTLAVALAL